MAACVVLTTVSDSKTAQRLTRSLVTKRLAACVSAIPGVVSSYRWKGKVERSLEVLLLIKTTRVAWPGVLRFLKENHPYDNPEILSLPVTEGSKEYLSWLNASLKK